MSGRESGSPERMSRVVTLRELTEDDLPILFTHQIDVEATRMAAFPSRDRGSFLEHWRKVLADDTGLKRCMVVNGEVAGYVVSWDSEDGRMIGYWVGREFWGKGVATDSVAAFLRIETQRPLRAAVAKHNIGSIRVLAKNGFFPIEERHSDLHNEGVDEIVFELT